MTRSFTVEHGGEQHGGPLPRVEPVQIATDDRNVEQLVRSARAGVARLSLELRVARHNAEVAEQRLDAEDEATIVDLPAARELLRTSLSQAVDLRRAALATEVEEARLEAARIVASAHRRAEAYLAAAHDGVLATVIDPARTLAPLPPVPPTVVPDDDPAEPESAPVREGAAVAPVSATALEVASILAALQLHPTTPLQPVALPVGVGPAAGPVHAPAPPVPAPVPPRPRVPLRSRLMHADVLLPLIAVVAVLLVLLAWVG
jgi:hypothetical protein